MSDSYVLHDPNREAGCRCLECQWRWEVQGIEALAMRGMTCSWRWDLHAKPVSGVSNAVRQTVPR